MPITRSGLIQIFTKCYFAAAAAVKSIQSCPTQCDPRDGSPPGSPVPGILQERTLEWVAIYFSNAWKWKGKVKLLSRVWLFETPWTAAYQALPSMGFSRQEYWSGVPWPVPKLVQLKVGFSADWGLDWQNFLSDFTWLFFSLHVATQILQHQEG